MVKVHGGGCGQHQSLLHKKPPALLLVWETGSGSREDGGRRAGDVWGLPSVLADSATSGSCLLGRSLVAVFLLRMQAFPWKLYSSFPVGSVAVWALPASSI